MKKGLVILFFALIIFGCSACGETKDLEQVSAQGSALTSEELSELSDIINSPEYSGFLEKAFERPEDIDWNAVLYGGAGIATNDVSDEETEAYLEETGEELYGEVVAIGKEDLEEFVKEHTGTDYSEAKHPYSGYYLEKYDKYYVQRSEGYLLTYECISGSKSGNMYAVTVQDKDVGRCCNKSIFTFKKDGNDLLVKANKFLWEDSADEVFDVTLSQYEEPAKAYRYGENVVDLVVGGNQLRQYNPKFEDKYIAVQTVDCFDANDDGRDDVIIVGIVDGSSHVNIFPDFEDGRFEPMKDYAQEIEGKLGSDFTMEDVKDYVQGK